MPTYPLATLAPTIGLSGISAPPYSDILLSLQESFKLIYGTDIYIQPDSQDGQWIAILAKAIHDSNQAAVAVFQSFSPTYAQGEGLSSVVKINGITRNTSGYSTVAGNVVGQAGTVITGGIVQDDDGNNWELSSPITIPIGGLIAVTATCVIAGEVIALAGSISKIFNPQLGWQSFISTSDAVVGAPIELDSTLRDRQTISTSLPASSILAGILSSVGNVPGVSRFAAYENDTSASVGGIPAHTMAIVAKGGDVTEVATAIALKKSPGAQTQGTTTVTVTDQYGIPSTINYFQLDEIPIYYAVTIKALAGYTSSTGDAIKEALAAFTNSLAIGEDIYASQSQAAASLSGLGIGKTFYITIFYQDIAPAPSSAVILLMDYTSAATSVVADISLTVT